jgi:hypothetical protein
MTHLGGWVPWKRSNKKKCNIYRKKINVNTKKLNNLYDKHGCRRKNSQKSEIQYNRFVDTMSVVNKKLRYSKRKCNRKKKQLTNRLNSHKNKMKKIKDCSSLLSPSKIATNVSPEKKNTNRLNQPYVGKRMSNPIQQQRGELFGPSKIATNVSPEKKNTNRLNQPYVGKRMSNPIQQQRGELFGPSTKGLQNAAAQNNHELENIFNENQNNKFNNIQRATKI